MAEYVRISDGTPLTLQNSLGEQWTGQLFTVETRCGTCHTPVRQLIPAWGIWHYLCPKDNALTMSIEEVATAHQRLEAEGSDAVAFVSGIPCGVVLTRRLTTPRPRSGRLGA